MEKKLYKSPKTRVVEFRMRTHIAAGSDPIISGGGDDGGGDHTADIKQSNMWSYMEDEEDY